MLKHNSKRVLDIIAGQKQRNAKRAYLEVHPNASPTTAESNVAQLLKKPESQVYLQEHVDKATLRVVELVDSQKEDIALRASTEVLDRNLGKSTQRIEQHSLGVTLNIDLSGTTGQQ